MMRGKSSGFRLSKIADGMYFGICVATNAGEDSVVRNLKGTTVFAHQYDAARKAVF
ncbi:MAG: hypothetical protein OXI33_18435 [Chloroflexota bacterium]|nr:hypothetical protein [Chloroflexota bacterium]